jgi:glycosyltransferase
VSEPDKNHFDAMNKGIRLSSGDIIGFLHADDFFASKRTIESVVNMFENKKVDCVWGDMVYIDKRNSGKIIRYWKSCSYKNNLFLKGWMPSHPSFFVKKKIYEKYGYFNIDMEISADYELMLRFLHKYGISGEYIPEVLVKMRLGGLSNGNFRNIIRKTLEDLKAWEMNGLKGKIPAIFLKNISKIPQFFIRQ